MSIKSLIGELKTVEHAIRGVQDNAERKRLHDEHDRLEAALVTEALGMAETFATDVGRIARALEWIAVSQDILAGKN